MEREINTKLKLNIDIESLTYEFLRTNITAHDLLKNKIIKNKTIMLSKIIDFIGDKMTGFLYYEISDGIKIIDFIYTDLKESVQFTKCIAEEIYKTIKNMQLHEILYVVEPH